MQKSKRKPKSFPRQNSQKRKHTNSIQKLKKASNWNCNTKTWMGITTRMEPSMASTNDANKQYMDNQDGNFIHQRNKIISINSQPINRKTSRIFQQRQHLSPPFLLLFLKRNTNITKTANKNNQLRFFFKKKVVVISSHFSSQLRRIWQGPPIEKRPRRRQCSVREEPKWEGEGEDCGETQKKQRQRASSPFRFYGGKTWNKDHPLNHTKNRQICSYYIYYYCFSFSFFFFFFGQNWDSLVDGVGNWILFNYFTQIIIYASQ